MLRQQIKLVIIAAFEPDGPFGSAPIPGELTLFRERLNLTKTLPFPTGYRPIYTDGQGTIALATGVGAVRAAATIMALGHDPRFDLIQAYFLITGVAGINPHQGSLASVVLPQYVIDGALTHELDAREIPPDWPDGFVPIGKSAPYEQPRQSRFNGDDGIVFRLNPALVTWAYALARTAELQDTPQMSARRQQFEPAYPAHRLPCVLRGDELASTTFFHGRLLSERAARWTTYQTNGQATYAITAMEDNGILQSLTFLAQAGNVDIDRVLVIRAASNYDQQREGITAAESLAETKVATYSAYRPALENSYRVASLIITALLANWPESPVTQDPT